MADIDCFVIRELPGASKAALSWECFG